MVMLQNKFGAQIEVIALRKRKQNWLQQQALGNTKKATIRDRKPFIDTVNYISLG